MKITTKHTLIAGGLAAALGLSSCVSPYELGPTTTASVTTYSPGYTVTTLPSGYRTETISGRPYYYYNGAYFQRRNGRYVVVTAPRSSRYYDEYTRYGHKTYHNHPNGSSHVVRQLPRGYTTETYNGVSYYRHQDRYYRRQGSDYVIVSRPY